MTDRWFISDTHFNHANFLNFLNEHGEQIRKFSSVEEMNEVMIENWNEVVKDDDKIYHLGDVSMANVTAFHNVMRRLKGKKTLIMGNHDDYKMSAYMEHFRDICSWKNFHDGPLKFIATHAPLHSESFFPHRAFVNVHGHIHEKLVYSNACRTIVDKRYINVCVEHHNYTPIHIDEIFKRVRKIHEDPLLQRSAPRDKWKD